MNKYFLEYSTLIVSGKDREVFLQGQLTSNVIGQKVGNYQWSARLDRIGKLKSWFLILKEEDRIKILIHSSIKQQFLDDINRFIIMDDVEIEQSNLKASVFDGIVNQNCISVGVLAGKIRSITFAEEIDEKSLDFKNEDLLNMFPTKSIIELDTMFNMSILNSIAIDYKKGCFLGQETVAKIENNRGSPYKMAVIEIMNGAVSDLQNIEIDNKCDAIKVLRVIDEKYALAYVFRNFQVINKVFTSNELQIKYLGESLSKYKNLDEALEVEFENAVRLFHQGHNEQAKLVLQNLIKISPDFEDAYESLGVILGREEKYADAIELMNQLEKINPKSVMANTNKSLFYMKMGKIEEAEKEKSEATFKSFSFFGDEAALKKEKEEALKKKKEDQERKKTMFEQIIEIDENDEMANMGLAEYYFELGNQEKAEAYSNIVCDQYPKNYKAMIIKAKLLLKLKKENDAKSIFEIAQKIAVEKGDVKTANEIQNYL